AEQKKYRALFENTVAALLIGKPDGSILEANSAACKMFGYTNEEIREIGRQGLIDPDTPGLKEKLKERSAKGSTKGELIGIRKNGERFWCDFSSSVFEGPGGDTLSSVMMVDISEEIEAQKQLEESNERYEYVTQATSDAIWDFMPDTGKLFWGEGFKNLFGYERYGVNTGIEKWMDNIHPDDIERIEAGVSELLAGSQSNWDQEYRFKKADGSYTFVRDKAIVVRDDSGHTVRLIGAMEDISDRKFREHQKAIAANISHVFNNAGTLYEALDESIKQIAKLKSFAMAEFWLVDRDKDVIRLISHYVLTDEMDGFYNVAGSENIFKKNTGLPGKTWAKEKPLFWRNLHKRKSFIRNEAAKTGGLKTAFSFPVKDTNGVMGVLILGLDTDIKKERYDVPLFKELANQLASEINRKQLEEELFRIFSSAPDVICVAGLDGYYKKVNPAMSELLGYSEKELLNTPIIDFVHPLDKQKTEDEFEALNRGEGNYYFENRHITKSGQVIWLSWTTKPFYNEGITYSVAKDVTEQKELEDLLEQANRLARIGSWEVDLIKNEVYWSDITRQIHEEEPGYELTLDDGISYYKEGEPRERIEQAVEEAMKQGTPWDLELPIITAKG
ncbi:MAG: PAS domain S-box protein, partial [Cyclobacteriaceae bacterium]